MSGPLPLFGVQDRRMSVAAREHGTAVLVTHEMRVGACAGPKVIVGDTLSSVPGAGR
jgi:hypothetical protein